jgi:nicotinamidase-related amidase
MEEAYVTSESLAAKTASWLDRIRPHNRRDMRLRWDAAALLVVDMQRFFLDPESPTYTCSGGAILPSVSRAIHVFRRQGRPVIYTRHVHHPDGLDAGIMAWWWDGMCLEGSPESEIHPQIAPLPGDKVVLKHRYSAFYNTDLETVLRCLSIRDVVVSGVMTNLCCESTARDAYYRDYRVFFLADGTGTVSEQMHVASLLNLAFGFAYVTTVDEVVRELTIGSASH